MKNSLYAFKTNKVKLFLIAILVFLINIPFGALRARHKKFSFMWFLYIHLPIPVVLVIRIYSDIGFALYTYPVLVGAFFLGQFAGRKYLPVKNNKNTR